MWDQIKKLANSSTPIITVPPEYSEAVKSDYDPGDGDFTVTQLITPPRRNALIQEHGKKDEPPESLWPSFLGTCLHDKMEITAKFPEGGFVEHRYYVDVLGKSVSGKIDRYDAAYGGLISDYKLMANQQYHAKPEHVAQIQMGGFLAEENGFKVSKGRLLYADKSWSITRAMRAKDYPSSPWSIFVLDYDRDLAEKLIHERVTDHVAALEGNPRDCTPDEMWQSPTKFAVKTKTSKRARKLCDSKEEAKEIKKPNELIEERPGENTFCEYFCGMKNICPQYKRQNKESKSPFELR